MKGIKEILESVAFKEALEEAIQKGMHADEASDGDLVDVFYVDIALDKTIEVLKKFLTPTQ